jgi:hypothetical protein
MPAASSSRRSASHRKPIVVESGAPRQQPGWPQVVLVAGAVVAVVLGAAALTGMLPGPLQRAIQDGPVLIGVLIVGTGWLLWRIAHGRPASPDQ